MVAQTIYAKMSAARIPTFPPVFPFWGSGAASLVVVDGSGAEVIARAGAIVTLIIDLGGVTSPLNLANASVGLAEVSGGDPHPLLRLFGAPAIINNRHGVRQNLVGLVAGGQYVANISARTATGVVFTAPAPFTAGPDLSGVPGAVYLTSDAPLELLTSDSGVALTAV